MSNSNSLLLFFKKRKKKLGEWNTFLKETIKPGHLNEKTNVYEPGPSLMLVYRSALSHKLNPLQFQNMINNLIETNQVELDPYQQRELQLIVEDPSRVFSVPEVLFGL